MAPFIILVGAINKGYEPQRGWWWWVITTITSEIGYWGWLFQ